MTAMESHVCDCGLRVNIKEHVNRWQAAPSSAAAAAAAMGAPARPCVRACVRKWGYLDVFVSTSALSPLVFLAG